MRRRLAVALSLPSPAPRALALTLLLAAFATLTTTPALAQGPSFASVAGHEFGDRITQHHQMVRYLEALAEASPRVTLLRQGHSWEGRELVAAVVTAPANHARIEEIKANAGRLADPRGLSADDVDGWLETQPVVVWMGGSIHGNELSGSEGLLKLLERLATSEEVDVKTALVDTVVIIDPIINPDGRDAFAHYNHRRLAVEPNAQRDDWANDNNFFESVGFRTGHYFFDTNRDWFAQSQRETRARVATWLEWRPQVVVDAHEMGADAEFFFDPPAPPFGSHFPPYAREGFELFNAAYAAAFDDAGFEYMTGERYNYFYPGYTTSFGSYHGAVGMLYEQGSSRGLALTRADGSVRTLADALEQQYTAAWAAVTASSSGRRELLEGYLAARRGAASGADLLAGEAARYLIPPGGDPLLTDELAALLLRCGVEVGVLTEEVSLGNLADRSGRAAAQRSFPAGTLVVEAAQPAGRLARVLLDPGVQIEQEFLAEARRRVDRGENPRFYDITSWSLPLLFGLPAYLGGAAPSLPVEPYRPAEEQAAAELPEDAVYAYLLDGRNVGSVAAMADLRRRGLRVAVLTAASRIGGEAVPAGTVIVRRAVNEGVGGETGDGVAAAVAESARRFGVAVRAVPTGLADERSLPSLGSGRTLAVPPGEVALLAEGPVHGYSFGWLWYTLAERYGVPLTVLRSGELAGTPLDRFDTLVIPDLLSAGALAGTLGDGGRDRLARWVRDGGNLVVIGDAVDLARDQLELIALESWYPEPSEGEEADDEQPQRFSVPGAILAGELDGEAWITAGYGADEQGADEEGASELPLLVDSSRIYLPPKGPVSPARLVAVRYASEPGEGDETDDARLLSGHVWPESLERLGGAVYLYVERVGRGQVIAFAEDPSFRAYHRGVERLLLNAVLLGPAAL